MSGTKGIFRGPEEEGSDNYLYSRFFYVFVDNNRFIECRVSFSALFFSPSRAAYRWTRGRERARTAREVSPDDFRPLRPGTSRVLHFPGTPSFPSLRLSHRHDGPPVPREVLAAHSPNLFPLGARPSSPTKFTVKSPDRRFRGVVVFFTQSEETVVAVGCSSPGRG